MFKRMLAAAAAALLLAPLGARAGSVFLDVTGVGASSGVQAGAQGAFIVTQSQQHPTGTGVIDSFVRIQQNGTEQGYNTSLSTPMETKAGNFTHALTLSEIPIVTIGGVAYREFLLDVNQVGNGFISLNQIQIFQSTADRDDATFSGPPANGTSPAVASFASVLGITTTQVFQMSNSSATKFYEIWADSGSGSGSGDMFLYVADSNFDPSKGNNVILYSQFGNPSGTYASNAGFEEWAVLQGRGSVAAVPEPSSIALALAGGLGFGLAGLRRLRRQKAPA